MSNVPDREQNEKVRERFTRSAEAFVKFAVPHRGVDAETIARLAEPLPTDVGLDLACGPGTFTVALARKTKLVLGFDLTPALLERARRKASAEGAENVALICGDATALPFRDGAFDVAVCGYSLHHMTEPRLALEEVSRVLRPGGRLAVVDLYVPEGADEETHNGVERARDASHTNTLTRRRFPRLVEAAGFRVRSAETLERPRLFSEWMQIAGWEPDDPHWGETRRRMASTVSGDAGGFHPHLLAGPGDGEPELEFTQSCLFLAAVKP